MSASRGPRLDPYCLEPQGIPLPVDGLLPPPLALVGEDDLPRQRPAWLRWTAAWMLAFFALATALTALATGGRASLLTGETVPVKPR